MIKSIYVAGRCLSSGMKKMSTIANNLANLNTTGYKRILPFNEVLSTYEPGKMKQLTDFQAGQYVPTSNPLDLALEGDAFFTIKTKEGIEFTKNGRLGVSEDGFLVDAYGDKVLGQGGEINLSKFLLNENPQLVISDVGEIRVGEELVDKLLISEVSEKQELKHRSESRYYLKNGTYSIAEESNYKVAQGYLEASNVNPIIEMESMIKLSNNYESSQKMINYLDQSLALSKEIGKV
jgi:flagellar basal-body rod protein FlgF